MYSSITDGYLGNKHMAPLGSTTEVYADKKLDGSGEGGVAVLNIMQTFLYTDVLLTIGSYLVQYIFNCYAS